MDAAFPRLSHSVALAVIHDLGIPAVDICVYSEGAHTSAGNVLADPVGTADVVLRRCEAAGLEVADVFLILGLEELAINHPDADVRAESFRWFEQAVRFVVRLSAPGITVLPGTTFEGVDPSDGLSLAASELQRRAVVAGESGLRVSCEAHVGSIVESPALTLELLERAPDVWLTLDHSHFIFQGIEQNDATALIPRSRHLQLRQSAPGMMQARAGEGALDLDRLRAQLDAGGYAGFVSIEYLHDEWLDCTRLDCVSETAALRELLLAHRVAG